jgi:hypothetical protein
MGIFLHFIFTPAVILGNPAALFQRYAVHGLSALYLRYHLSLDATTMPSTRQLEAAKEVFEWEMDDESVAVFQRECHLSDKSFCLRRAEKREVGLAAYFPLLTV